MVKNMIQKATGTNCRLLHRAVRLADEAVDEIMSSKHKIDFAAHAARAILELEEAIERFLKSSGYSEEIQAQYLMDMDKFIDGFYGEPGDFWRLLYELRGWTYSELV